MKRENAIQNLSQGDKVDFEFPFFMLYLRAISSLSLQRLEMLRIASEKSIFEFIGKYLQKILFLSSQWRYPQQDASSIIAEKAPTPEFRVFLEKFSQSIGSGEPLNDFVDRHYKNWFAQYVASREQALNRLKTLSDAYLPMLSVTLFLTTTMLVSSIFYDANTMITLTIVTVICISFFLYLISWMIYKNAKPEAVLLSGQAEKPIARKKVENLGVIGVVAALVSFFVPFELLLPAIIDGFMAHVTLAGIILLIPGYMGRKYIKLVHAREDIYPSYFRYMSSNLGVGIPLVEIAKSAVEIDFGVMNKAIRALYNKLAMRVEPKVAWWSFETELDSELIRRINLILTDTIATGGDVQRAGKFIEEFYHNYSTLRRTRYTAVGYHVGIVVPLYAVMGGLFGILDGFFASLTTFLGRIQGYVPFLSPPSTEFMRFFFIFSLCLFALNNVFSIYNMEGDSRFTIMYFLGIQVTAGGIIYLITSTMVASLLGGVTVL